MKVPEPENVLLLFLIIAFIALILLVFNGCAAKQARDLHILWVCPDGVFHATGLSAASAKEMSKEFEFRNCEVLIREKEGVKK